MNVIREERNRKHILGFAAIPPYIQTDESPTLSPWRLSKGRELRYDT